jgi:hypothetical protein
VSWTRVSVRTMTVTVMRRGRRGRESEPRMTGFVRKSVMPRSMSLRSVVRSRSRSMTVTVTVTVRGQRRSSPSTHKRSRIEFEHVGRWRSRTSAGVGHSEEGRV